MALAEKFGEDLKSAMKAKDGNRVAVLRLLIAALKNRRIEAGRDLTDEQVMEVVSSQVKRRNESIEAYRQGERPDLVAQEEAELAILKEYLPRQFTPEELASLVAETIEAVGASSPKDLGAVMKVLMPQIKGRADGKLAKETAEKLLAGS